MNPRRALPSILAELSQKGEGIFAIKATIYLQTAANPEFRLSNHRRGKINERGGKASLEHTKNPCE